MLHHTDDAVDPRLQGRAPNRTAERRNPECSGRHRSRRACRRRPAAASIRLPGRSSRCAVVFQPKGTTSTGMGCRSGHRRSTILLSSTTMAKRRLAAATSFSSSSAPPRPLIRFRVPRSTSSAPSIARSMWPCSSSVVRGMARLRASAAVLSELGMPVMRSPWATRRPMAVTAAMAVDPLPSPITIPFSASAAAASATASLSSSCVGIPLLYPLQNHRRAVEIAAQIHIQAGVHQVGSAELRLPAPPACCRWLPPYTAPFRRARADTMVGAAVLYSWECRKANSTACLPSAETYWLAVTSPSRGESSR